MARTENRQRRSSRRRNERRLGTALALGIGVMAVGLFFWKRQAPAPASLVHIESPVSVAASEQPSLLLGDSGQHEAKDGVVKQTEEERTLSISLTPRPDSRSIFLSTEAISIHALLPATPEHFAGPVDMQLIGDDLFFLARGTLYRQTLSKLENGNSPQAETYMPPDRRIRSGERIRELFAMASDGQQLWLLDKSNDLYRYTPATGLWEAEALAFPSKDQPDPHYITLSWAEGKLWLLDYARNQIWWKSPGKGQVQPYFHREVVTWNLQPGDRDLSKSIDLSPGPVQLVLTSQGRINRYVGDKVYQPWLDLAKLPQPYMETFPKSAWRRLIRTANKLYVLDAGKRRILQLNANGTSMEKQYILPADFAEGGRLHDLFEHRGQLYLLAGELLASFTPQPQASVPKMLNFVTPRNTVRLQGFIPPIAQALMPDNAALLPGSRRLYRHGIHEGADFFDRYQPQAGGKLVGYSSPVRAIKEGKVLRADHAFLEMSPATHQEVLAACRQQHETSRQHENLFRGRQIWIEHEDGAVSIYAHLSEIQPGLQTGKHVAQGELIGRVGNSGTSNGVAGNKHNPHLHLELWLSRPDDPVAGEYLGKWLSFSETRELWETLLQGAPS